MKSAELEKKLQHFQSVCQANGLRMTRQKSYIFEVLASDFSHPTAEDLYQKVKKAFPSISLATVYDNLKKFKHLNLIREMSTANGPSRFDANMDQHHHIVVEATGEVMDVELEGDQAIPLPKILQGKTVRDIKITYVI